MFWLAISINFGTAAWALVWSVMKPSLAAVCQWLAGVNRIWITCWRCNNLLVHISNAESLVRSKRSRVGMALVPHWRTASSAFCCASALLAMNVVSIIPEAPGTGVGMFSHSVSRLP